MPEASNVIVVGWDFSDAAHQVLAWAAGHAKRVGGQLLLVHVLELPTTTDLLNPPLSADEIDKMKDTMLGLATRHGVEASALIVISTSVSRALIEAANEHQAALLCVGRNRTGLSRLLLGSVANQVARHSPLPVLVVLPAAS